MKSQTSGEEIAMNKMTKIVENNREQRIKGEREITKKD